MNDRAGIKNKKSEQPSNDQYYRDDVQKRTHNYVVYPISLQSPYQTESALINGMPVIVNVSLLTGIIFCE